MTLWLADKHDLHAEERLSAAEEAALRTMAAGAGGDTSQELALAILNRCQKAGLWLACDCRGEREDRPYLAPCRRGDALHWYRLHRARQHHDQNCVFHRLQNRKRDADAQRWNRKARTEPKGFFAVPLDDQAGRRVATGDGQTGNGGRGAHPPALSRLLLKLIARAGLSRTVAGEKGRRAHHWLKDLGTVAAGEQIAPGRALRDLWFPYPRMWDRRVVHARLRKAARDWPPKPSPQGFLCWMVEDTDDDSVRTRAEGTRVDVADGLVRPIIEGTPVSGPWLFIGVVGLRDRARGYECLKGWAQPIAASDWPVPVDSHAERLAFHTLRTTLDDLQSSFPDARFGLEKPVFDTETPNGPCIPDFVIAARRREDVVRFVIEVMGFERLEYQKGKQVTHPRMESLGHLCLMDATRFGQGIQRVRSEGNAVTSKIDEALRERWGRK